MIAILATLAITAVALTAIAGLVRTERGADLLTPTPRAVVQTFVGSLAANRPVQAHARLTDAMRAQITTNALARLGRTWHAAYGRFRVAGGTLERAGERAVYRATLETTRGRVARVFTLHRDAESRLWQIETFDGPGQITRASPPAPARDAPRANRSP